MSDRHFYCQSFPPVASRDACLLILGSMPGEKSLKEQRYYAHPQNLFWPIIERVFGIARDLDYRERLRLLQTKGIALWDVAQSCERPGSLDSKIELSSVVPNDFNSFFSAHRKIRAVFFNGHKAEQLFKKLALPRLGDRWQTVTYVRLPSTSPAHASLTREQKIKIWLGNLRPSCSRAT